MRAFTLVSLLVLGAPPAARAQRQSAPSVGTWALGQRWAEVGRSLPCQGRNQGRGAGRPAPSLAEWSHCRTADSTSLFFRDSTLAAISWISTIFVIDRPFTTGSEVWLRSQRDHLLTFFGEPDSVRRRSVPEPNGSVIATWAPSPTRAWGLVVCIQPIQTTETDGSKAAAAFVVDGRLATPDDHEAICYTPADQQPWSDSSAAQPGHEADGAEKGRRLFELRLAAPQLMP